MQILVQKFGGSSLASVADIKRCAAITQQYVTDFAVVVVVSAMGNTTNNLCDLASDLHCKGQERDMILSSAEQVSVGLFASALGLLNIPCKIFLGWQIPIFTDSNHSFAKITSVCTKKIKEALENGFVAVVAGFQGVCNGKITTLGRGGSDVTAVALTKSLDAKKCRIYTDVNGLMPIYLDSTKKSNLIKKVGCEQILEMSLKEKLLHERAIEIKRNDGNFKLSVSSSFNKGLDGTEIVHDIEKSFGPAVTTETGLALVQSDISNNLLNFLNKEKIAAKHLLFIEGKIFATIDKLQFRKICKFNWLKAIKGVAVINIVGDCEIKNFENITKITHALKVFKVYFMHTTNIRITIAVDECSLSQIVARLEKAFYPDA